jgi:hypothetical protein
MGSMRLTEDDRRILRVVGIIASGLVLVESYATSDPPRSALTYAAHALFPIALYIFARLWMAEGRARERRSQQQRNRSFSRKP